MAILVRIHGKTLMKCLPEVGGSQWKAWFLLGLSGDDKDEARVKGKKSCAKLCSLLAVKEATLCILICECDTDSELV